MSEEKLTPWQQYKKNLGDTRPWDIMNPNVEIVDKEVSDNRMNTCISCPSFIELTKQCKKCGCYMPAKTRLKKATCPMNKW